MLLRPLKIAGGGDSSIVNCINNGKLNITISNYTFIFLKHNDIVRFVKNGILDLGISSQEWIYENEFDCNIIKAFDWCDTRISLITTKSISTIKSCVTEFPCIAKKYFQSRNIDVDIVSVSGSTESLVPCKFDCSIDCVETGNTLKANNLIIQDTLCASKIVLFSREQRKDFSVILEDFGV